jgi:ABC-type Mn2+/Zn2+ transport system ATPase subunit
MVAPDTPATLTVSELEVRYGSLCALRGVHFSCVAGTSLALLGGNGAGKSTLLKALAGVLPLARGTVRWSDGSAGRHRVAYLPQREAVDWDFPITVRGLVELGRFPRLGLFRRYTAEDEAVVVSAITAMRLAELQHRQISALSGGQQQRAFIARALAQEADVLLLDEPFTGLDQPAQDQLSELMKELTTQGRLLIASHHNLSTVADLFDRALLLMHEVVAFGAPQDVLTEPNLERAFSE